MEDQSRNPVNFLKGIRFLYRWKITFLAAVLPSAILAYILASPPFTDPLYRSVTTFYPTSEGALSDQVIHPDGVHEEGYLNFGEEQRVEVFLETLNSEKIKGIMLKQFNLFEHYDIPQDAANRYKRFSRTFKSNVEISKTQFQAVKVEVLDEDPGMAADMANALVQAADSLQNQLRNERAQNTLRIVKDKYQQQQNRVATLADSVKALADKGLVAFEEQSERLVETLGKARLENQGEIVRRLENKLDVVGQYGPVYHGLIEQITYVNERIGILYETYERIKADAEEKLSNVYVIDKAKPSSDDAKPNKPLIVALVLVGSFIITALLARTYERWSVLKAEITG